MLKIKSFRTAVREIIHGNILLPSPGKSLSPTELDTLGLTSKTGCLSQ